jgi:hypothetical protein
MNLIKPIVFASLAALAGGASAQASKFQGAFGQIGIGYESASPTSTSASIGGPRGSLPASPNYSNANSFTGTIGLGWYQEIAKGYLLGLGAEYSPINGESSSYNVSSVATVGGVTGSVNRNYTYQKQNSYNIFLSPAMTVGNDGLAYLKVGYTGAQFHQYNSLDANYTGYSLGLGYKQFFSGGWYGFGEVNYANYGSQTVSTTTVINNNRYTASGSGGMNTTNILVGVGYKF